jgi:hypothetical protein
MSTLTSCTYGSSLWPSDYWLLKATMSTSRITELAQLIATQTSAIDVYLKDNDLPQPSFDKGVSADGINRLTPELTSTKNDVIEATIELRQLLEGPLKLLLPESNFSPLAAVHHFHIAAHVPVESRISFSELAAGCGLLEHDLKRIVRFVIVHHRIFSEPEKGFVQHSGASKLLYESEMGIGGKGFVKDLMGLTFRECWPAHGRVSIHSHIEVQNSPI